MSVHIFCYCKQCRVEGMVFDAITITLVMKFINIFRRKKV